MSDDFMERRIEQRIKGWRAEWQQLLNDAAHWNRMHPNEPPIVIEPIAAEEIEARRSALESAKEGG